MNVFVCSIGPARTKPGLIHLIISKCFIGQKSPIPNNLMLTLNGKGHGYVSLSRQIGEWAKIHQKENSQKLAGVTNPMSASQHGHASKKKTLLICSLSSRVTFCAPKDSGKLPQGFL